MYKFIKNPKTNRNVNTNSRLGKQILNLYLKYGGVIADLSDNNNMWKKKSDFIYEIFEKIEADCQQYTYTGPVSYTLGYAEDKNPRLKNDVDEATIVTNSERTPIYHHGGRLYCLLAHLNKYDRIMPNTIDYDFVLALSNYFLISYNGKPYHKMTFKMTRFAEPYFLLKYNLDWYRHFSTFLLQLLTKFINCTTIFFPIKPITFHDDAYLKAKYSEDDSTDYIVVKNLILLSNIQKESDICIFPKLAILEKKETGNYNIIAEISIDDSKDAVQSITPIKFGEILVNCPTISVLFNHQLETAKNRAAKVSETKCANYKKNLIVKLEKDIYRLGFLLDSYQDLDIDDIKEAKKICEKVKDAFGIDYDCNKFLITQDSQ